MSNGGRDHENQGPERCLKVYSDRSVLVEKDGTESEYLEGKLSNDAEERLELIKTSLHAGYLEDIIEGCYQPDVDLGELPPDQFQLLETLVDSVTSEVGRAIVGLAVLQLTVKSICPQQSVRLHKGGRAGGQNFAWREGIPMRTLDKSYITPALRRYGLLRLNADGIMMTRSLAENYPYSGLYKAAIRGAKREWAIIVDLIETEEIQPIATLKHLIALLINRSERFAELADKTLELANRYVSSSPSQKNIAADILSYIDLSSYSARVFEVAMHSFFQVLEDNGLIEGSLKPLSQMRSANKKHGDIGDVEVLSRPETMQIIESWDAKYGKAYLRDELEELNDKLQDHPETEIAGFVVESAPDLRPEITERIEELEEMHGIDVYVISFNDWFSMQMEKLSNTPEELDRISREWFIAFTESLCQRRRDRAPIDEPSDVWVASLADYMRSVI